MYGSRWKNYLDHISKNKNPRQLESESLKICRRIFQDITGFKFNHAKQFTNSLVLTPHRIIVKSNIVSGIPDYEYEFKCYRDEFLFKPQENDWIVFMGLNNDFKKAWIMGKSFLPEIMPTIDSVDVREFFFKRKYFLPVEFNMVHLEYKKRLKKSHSVHHDTKTLQD